MMKWLRKLLAGTATAVSPGRQARPVLEALEERVVPTVTYHGGALLSHVAAQALYLGSDWQRSPIYRPQTAVLDRYLQELVSGPYMDMLGGAGYAVGRGTADPGRIGDIAFDRSLALSDATIRGYIQGYIANGMLKPPTSQRLYVVFVEDNVVVRTSDGLISRTDFLGYHAAFAGHDPFGFPADIRYAVIAYPGGAIGNAAVAGVGAINDLTEVSSHEVAEAVTDPDVNYSVLGWYDDVDNEEAGDLVNQEFVTVNGFAVQRIADRNGQGMTPAGAAPLRPVTFVLLDSGRLFAHTTGGWTFLADSIISVSDQSIDNSGRAVVDVVRSDGQAFEYHDSLGWVPLGSNVRQAEAGQGVSYVLRRDGRLYEYRDDSAQWTTVLASGVSSIDAGTDRYGVNSVDVVFNSGALSTYSDTTGWHSLCGGVKSVSAGPLGVSVVLLRTGQAYQYRQLTNTWTFLVGNVAHVAAGFDPTGGAIVEVIYTSGTAAERRGGVWHTLSAQVATVSEAHSGLCDVVLTNGNSYEHTAAGWAALSGATRLAV
jgi:hypothetical protein